MSTYEDTLELKGINQKIMAAGEDLPLVQLKDGSRLQTGTVATMLFNIQLYNARDRGPVEQELTAAIPTLFKAGLFELFPVEEWVEGTNAGRRFVGEAAMKYMGREKKPRKRSLYSRGCL